VLGAFILSEFITPAAELQASESRLALLGRTDDGRLSSGYWFKEADAADGTRILNIHTLGGQGHVKGITLYEFGRDDRLQAYVEASSGQFGQGQLTLHDLTETRIHPQSTAALADARAPMTPITEVIHLNERRIPTSLTPERLIARVLTPERMSISDLLDYLQYLHKNHLQTERQEVALWRKIAYPFTLLVMITIAAPIGFMQTRRGGVGLKVFAGILLGVGFFMLNQLALNAGTLGDWPPWATALVPSLAGLGLAFLTLVAMEHRHHLSLWLRQRRLERRPAS
jgi:lipopolysaccharide export system permease protein